VLQPRLGIPGALCYQAMGGGQGYGGCAASVMHVVCSSAACAMAQLQPSVTPACLAMLGGVICSSSRPFMRMGQPPAVSRPLLLFAPGHLQGLYVGTACGRVQLLDPTTLQPPSCEGSTIEASTAVQAFDGLPVSHLALNRSVLAAACARSGAVRLLSHAGPGRPPELTATLQLTAAGVAWLDFGGPDAACLLAGGTDATLHLGRPAPGGGAMEPQLLGDFHAGPIAGAAAHADGQHVLTAGADGSLRMWHATDGALRGKRTFSSAQTCLAAAACLPLAVLGSETGVVRCVP
jgi:WD40 repeat protein